MNVQRNNWFAVLTLVAAAWLAAGVAYVRADEVVVVEVPEGKKVILVDEKFPVNKACVTVKPWHFMPVPTPVEPKQEECDKLVLSPAIGCSNE